MDAVMSEQIVVGISRVALKLMEYLLSNEDQASRHGASVVENNSEFKKAELSYYKKSWNSIIKPYNCKENNAN